MRSDDEFAPRRILVALDDSRHGLAALEAAAELAACMQAELLALFVEDVNLLRLARLPHQHLSFDTGAGQPLDEATVEAHFRTQAALARAALLAAGTRRHVSVSFRVARGLVSAEVLAAASEADLLILGWAGRGLPSLAARGSDEGAARRVGRTARAAAERAPRSVLLWTREPTLQRPVVAVDEGAPRAALTLTAAARLAAALGRSLTVLVTGDTPEEARARLAAADEWLRARGVEARLASTPDPARLRALLRAERGAVLVLAAESPLLADPPTRALVEELGCALLLVR
jgi:nucleotide-binding universal stress UspA family protein